MKLSVKKIASLVLSLMLIMTSVIIPMNVLAEDTALTGYHKIINYGEVFADYPSYVAQHAANMAMLSWWEAGWDPAPAGVSTQAFGSKYGMSKGLDTGSVVVENNDTGTMKAIRLVPAETGVDTNAVFALKNGGGVGCATEIPTTFNNANAVVIRMSVQTHPGLVGNYGESYGVYFELYEKKTTAVDNRDIGEKFSATSAADLVGTTVYLVDAATGAITSKDLGTNSADATEQENSKYFVNETFDGWIVLPLSYFAYDEAGSLETTANHNIDMTALAGITVGEKNPQTGAYSRLWVGEIGVTNNVTEFLTAKGNMAQYNKNYDAAEITAITAEELATMAATPGALNIDVNADSVLQYNWNMSTLGMTATGEFNPAIIKYDTIAEFGSNLKNITSITTAFKTPEYIPSNDASLKIKLNATGGNQAWYVYKYNKADDVLELVQTATDTEGYVTLKAEANTSYLINISRIVKISDSLNGYVPLADFEFDPFAYWNILPEALMYNLGVLHSGVTVSQGPNSNSAFAYGNVGNSIQFWPYAESFSSVFNLANTMDKGANISICGNGKAVAVKLAIRDVGLENVQMSFAIYEGASETALGEKFGKAADLTGKKAWTVVNGIVTEIDLGVNPYFVQDGFDGWVILPLSYFANTAGEMPKLTNATGLEIAVTGANTNMTYAIDEIGVITNLVSFLSDGEVAPEDGDVNNDGSVDVIDLVVVKKVLAKIEVKHEYAEILSDIDNDFTVSSLDLTSLRRTLLGEKGH